MNSSSAPRGADPIASARRCVLVVEDEFLIRAMLSEELRDAGYHVIGAFNADEALKVLDVIRVDLIVSDVRMPGSMDGIAFLRLIRETSPTMPVIITSGHLPPTLVTTDGATLFVPKPYSLESVVKIVAHELEKAS